MYVCICRRVCDRTMRRVIAEGNHTVEQVGKACGAGTGCGACRETIVDFIAEHAQHAAPHAQQTTDGERCPRPRLPVLSPYLAPDPA